MKWRTDRPRTHYPDYKDCYTRRFKGLERTIDISIFHTREMGWDFTAYLADTEPNYTQVYTSWHTGYVTLDTAKKCAIHWAKKRGFTPVE